jgi:DeoR/GlpR family transcriptional regulator of sugar metabolism
MAKSRQTKDATEFRRNLIEDEVMGEARRIAFTEVYASVLKKFPSSTQVSETTLYNDRDYFRKNEKPIDIERKAFVYSEEGLTTVAKRGSVNPHAKELIGALGSKIIVSPPPERRDDKRGRDLSVSEVFLQDGALPPLAGWLERRIASYWLKPHRLAILDSGTTNGAVAGHLKILKSPDPGRHLAQLRVLTNGLNILEELKDSSHGVILLGGSFRRDTGAVAGLLAERCLDVWGLDNADVAVIGTTNLNNRLEFCCDSEEEAAVKSRLLHAARIRCIAADAEKLMGSKDRGSSWAFAPLSDSVVDLIITDSDILKLQQKDPDREEARQEFLKAVRDNGVYIAVGSEMKRKKGN